MLSLQYHPSPRAAFTLIEMLVVIAIISTLASMLSPALRNAYDMGLNTSCKNNEHQLYFLMHQYLEDNNGTLPSAYMQIAPTDTSKLNSWITPMAFYAGMITENTRTKYHSWAWSNKNPSSPSFCGILRCPADSTIGSDNIYYANYGFAGGMATNTTPVSLDYAKPSRIISPSKVCMVSDCYRNGEKADNTKKLFVPSVYERGTGKYGGSDSAIH